MGTGLYAVVITGSRDWADEPAVTDILDAEIDEAIDAGGFRGFLVIHGDCKTGADAMADKWGQQVSEQTLPMPAQWDEHDKAAGPIRNNQMASAARCLQACGWTVTCHAFGLAQSKGGTKNCVQALEAQGFEVTEHD